MIGAALAPAAALADDADPDVIGCPAPLSVISWNGAEGAGDPHALATTAQFLDADTEGCTNWQAAAGTTLTAVTAIRIDGGVAALPAEPTGTASDIVALAFCGTTQTTAAPPERVEGDPLTVAITARALDLGEPGWSHAGWEPAVGTSLRAVFVTAPDHTAPDHTMSDHTENDDIANHETEEVEVLGIQLTREDEPSGSAPLGTGVALFAVLALLATAGGVLWSRHS